MTDRTKSIGQEVQKSMGQDFSVLIALSHFTIFNINVAI